MIVALCRGENRQGVELSEAVINRYRLSTRAVARLAEMLDGRVTEVWWSAQPLHFTNAFPHWIGRAQRVTVQEGDETFWAQVQRGGSRPIWGRFVAGRRGAMARSLTAILHPREEGWEVVAAYAGPPAPPFPGDPFAGADSRDFWSRHALVEGALPYHRGTKTAVCPW